MCSRLQLWQFMEWSMSVSFWWIRNTPNTCWYKQTDKQTRCSHFVVLQACLWSHWQGDAGWINWAQQGPLTRLQLSYGEGGWARFTSFGPSCGLCPLPLQTRFQAFPFTFPCPSAFLSEIFIIWITLEHPKCNVFKAVAWMLRPVAEKASISPERV